MSATGRGAQRVGADFYPHARLVCSRPARGPGAAGRGGGSRPAAGGRHHARRPGMRADVAWWAVELREGCRPALEGVQGVASADVITRSFLDLSLPLSGQSHQRGAPGDSVKSTSAATRGPRSLRTRQVFPFASGPSRSS